MVINKLSTSMFRSSLNSPLIGAKRAYMPFCSSKGKIEPHPVNLSHNQKTNEFTLEDSYKRLRDKILSRGDIGDITLKSQISILDQLMQFPLGRFLIENRGLNGYWTDYIISGWKEVGGHDISELEYFMLNHSPSVKATRQRFDIFKFESQKILRSGMCICSIPCGIMRDLLELKYDGLEGVKLVGIDVDPLSLEMAEKKVKDEKTKGKVLPSIRFIEQDAWGIQFEKEFDLILSNGLNIYEEDREKRLRLYGVFFQALNTGGTLITSFMSPPPKKPVDHAEELLKDISSEHMMKEKLVIAYVLGANWMNFQKPEEIRQELQNVGFQEIQVMYDKNGLFPTVLAKRL